MMKKKYGGVNVPAFFASLLLVVSLLCGLTYAAAPDNVPFGFAQINPVDSLSGGVFALSFGLGLPPFVAAIVLVLALLLLLVLFYQIMRRII